MRREQRAFSLVVFTHDAWFTLTIHIDAILGRVPSAQEDSWRLDYLDGLVVSEGFWFFEVHVSVLGG